MARLSIEVDGLNETLKKFRRFGEEGEKIIADTTEIQAREIELNAKKLAPVDTGKMRQAIKAEPSTKLSWFITAYEHYSKFVEFGTVRQSAQPFLRPAFVRGSRQYIKDLRQALKVLTKKFNQL